jgi:hypothetical protein
VEWNRVFVVAGSRQEWDCGDRARTVRVFGELALPIEAWPVGFGSAGLIATVANEEEERNGSGGGRDDENQNSAAQCFNHLATC